MGNITGAVALIVALFGLAAIVAGIVVYLKAGIKTGIEKSLREHNKDLTDRVTFLENEVVRHQESEKSLTARITVLETENAFLKTLKSGADAVKEIGAIVAEQDRSRAAEHHDILATVQMEQSIFAAHHEEVMSLLRSIEKSCHSHGDN